MDLGRALAVAVAAARAAARLLRDDFHRASGARGEGDKAEVDQEAELLIRARLLEAFPGWSYLGEETGRAAGAPDGPIWLVDPNDGTRDYLEGRRGSAISIGLVCDRQPVLGVVHAFGYPDDEGDLFAWAEGCGPLRRNGNPLAAQLPTGLGPSDVVLVSSNADRDPETNLRCVAPARFRAIPSVAHRLALVAAGEGAAATALFSPGAWDYAAGHALLRAAGGVLVDEHGREVGYAGDGTSATERAFGGSAAVAAELAQRPWDPALFAESASDLFPARLRRGEAVADAGPLARAQGCLLGQFAGDSLGSLVEFARAPDVAARYPDGGPRALADGGTWDLLAGQGTDDSEMALALARSIVAEGRFERGAVKRAYQEWLRSEPFDIGGTVRAALVERLNPHSKANGSLMRACPLGIYAHALPPRAAAELAHQDSRITHPNPACLDAVAAFVVAISHALRAGDGPQGAYEAATRWAEASGTFRVREALRRAAAEPPVCDLETQGYVLIALQNAFYELLHAPSLEAGVVATVRRGGDTDTNGAIAGALLGAVHGREAVPAQWRQMILSCRALPRCSRRPRPPEYWPVDVLEVAERLLLAGEAAGQVERPAPPYRAALPTA
jgi:ADP-ribosylglycohydrolase/fructose-1,6-bisphosphatase/inositol monophosphatase family enzyme